MRLALKYAINENGKIHNFCPIIMKLDQNDKVRTDCLYSKHCKITLLGFPVKHPKMYIA